MSELSDISFDEELFPTRHDLSEQSFDSSKNQPSLRDGPGLEEPTTDQNCPPNIINIIEEPINASKNGTLSYEELKHLQGMKKTAERPKWNDFFHRSTLPTLNDEAPPKKSTNHGNGDIVKRSMQWSMDRDRRMFEKAKAQYLRCKERCPFRPKLV